MEAMKEIQLVKLAADGEADAYCTLVERYQAGVIIHCERLVADRSVAEDIAQDAFVKAYYSLNRYDAAKGTFSTWLYAIATNLVKDYFRQSRPHVDIDGIAETMSAPQQLSASEKREVHTAVANLEPPEYARVIRAYYWEGRCYEDIANELRVPVSTIGTWLNRAKVQLRKELS
jgi:RNA polymerase sigma-70 factor (ECF subfamily)